MMTATYSPDDNKLRLYSTARLDAETYARVKAAGFAWAPKQDLFVAPMWTPRRADLLIELCGDIDDEDTSLSERQDDRADRFEGYSDSRREDADRAHAAVARIADGIPLGQPILVGHHSERRARRDAERIQNGMRATVRAFETAAYWTRRAEGARRLAKYKELPNVRARRIKRIEADRRKSERVVIEARIFLRQWTQPDLTREHAAKIANFDHVRMPSSLKHPYGRSAWDALAHDEAADVAAIAAHAIKIHEEQIAWATRWIEHYDLRLAYERAMLDDAGGTVADRTAPQKGGGVRCWASPRNGWSWIVKVNKVSVTVWDNWGNGGANFTRTIPFDKLTGIMTPAEVEAARAEGRLIEEQERGGRGFYIAAAAPLTPEAATESQAPAQDAPPSGGMAAAVAAMRDTLRAGVRAVRVPHLVPTPAPLAAAIAELADPQPGHKILEPSAGTGSLIVALRDRIDLADLHAVEINPTLAGLLRERFPAARIETSDFLNLDTTRIGTFDRIVMNPPFDHGSDIDHIRRAAALLRPGGRLVGVCAAGPRQVDALRPMASTWRELPADAFKDQGVNVRTVLFTIDNEGETR